MTETEGRAGRDDKQGNGEWRKGERERKIERRRTAELICSDESVPLLPSVRSVPEWTVQSQTTE